MSSIEQALCVYLDEKNVATIYFKDNRWSWVYDATWQQTGDAVSRSIPQNNQITSLGGENFLPKLLPEGERLVDIVQFHQLSIANTRGLIQLIGQDLAGALIILSINSKLDSVPQFKEL